jgi:heat shock protein HtpX
MPKLKVMDTDALNAFATGLNRRQYAVTVTTGLMKELNDREMEAVLGHELTHIRNGDVQLMVIAVIIAGVVGFVAELVFRIFQGGARIGGGWSSSGSSSSSSWGGSSRSSSSGGSSDSKGGGAIVILLLAAALIALAWFLSQVVRLALSRSRELMADAGSVELTKDADAMISALRKIENRGELPGATSAVMEMCVDNPREGFSDLFATHPSIDARVRALVTYAGGHDPGPMRSHYQYERDETGAPAHHPRLPGGQELPPGPWSDPAPPTTAAPPVAGPWSDRS